MKKRLAYALGILTAAPAEMRAKVNLAVDPMYSCRNYVSSQLCPKQEMAASPCFQGKQPSRRWSPLPDSNRRQIGRAHV